MNLSVSRQDSTEVRASNESLGGLDPGSARPSERLFEADVLDTNELRNRLHAELTNPRDPIALELIGKLRAVDPPHQHDARGWIERLLFLPERLVEVRPRRIEAVLEAARPDGTVGTLVLTRAGFGWLDRRHDPSSGKDRITGEKLRVTELKPVKDLKPISLLDLARFGISKRQVAEGLSRIQLESTQGGWAWHPWDEYPSDYN
jgi:hypothetical protein